MVSMRASCAWLWLFNQARARKLMAVQTMERCWKLWLELVTYNRAVSKAVKFWTGATLQERFTAWKEKAQAFAKHRREEEKRGEMRQTFMEMDMQALPAPHGRTLPRSKSRQSEGAPSDDDDEDG